eukprot:9334687-Alexandrium_andersonii.AAC.1
MSMREFEGGAVSLRRSSVACAAPICRHSSKAAASCPSCFEGGGSARGGAISLAVWCLKGQRRSNVETCNYARAAH